MEGMDYMDKMDKMDKMGKMDKMDLYGRNRYDPSDEMLLERGEGRKKLVKCFPAQ